MSGHGLIQGNAYSNALEEFEKKSVKANPSRLAGLHVHSEYSFLDGFSSTDMIALRASQLGQEAVAITDHGEVSGHLAFERSCKKFGVKPIYGCLLAGQEILTSEGIKKVEDISVGDMVLTHKGRFRRVLRTMTRNYEGLGYEISLAGRYSRKLTLTEEHPVLVRRDGEYVWLKPGELKTDFSFGKSLEDRWSDFVCLPKMEKTQENLRFDMSQVLPNDDGWDVSEGAVSRTYDSKYGSPRTWPLVSESLEIDEGFAYLLAMYASEGSVRKKEGAIVGTVEMTVHKRILDKVEPKLRETLASFGSSLGVYYRKDKVRENTVDLVFTSLPLAVLLKTVVGDSSENKRIPWQVLSSPDSVKKSFLEGLLDGDCKSLGLPSNNKKQSAALRVTSESFAWGFRQLIADIGHFNGVAFEARGRFKDIYTVEFNPNRSFSRTVEDDEYVCRPVKAVEEVSLSCQVYNFEVEEDNSYVSDFILHNCEGYQVDSVQRVRAEKDRKNNHYCVWAKSNKGLKNLWALSSRAYMGDNFYYRPLAEWGLLEEHSEGLIVSDGCLLSDSARFILEDKDDLLRQRISKFLSIFGDDFVMELHTWRLMDPKTEEDKKLNADMAKVNAGKVQVAQEMGVPLIVVNDAHYAWKEDWENHSLVWAMSTNSDQTERGESAAWIMSDEEMVSAMSDHGIPASVTLEAIENTSSVVADRCNVTIEKRLHIPSMTGSPKKDEELFLSMVEDGFQRKIIDSGDIPKDMIQTYVDQMDYQVDLILKKKFAGYFLVVADYCRYAKSADPEGKSGPFKGKEPWLMGSSRGSAAGSLPAFLLDITEIDPIKYDLLPERFIDPGRGSKIVISTEQGKVAVDPGFPVYLESGEVKEAQDVAEADEVDFSRLEREWSLYMLGFDGWKAQKAQEKNHG